MNNPSLNISAQEGEQLDRQVHGFKKLNGFHTVELYQVTDAEVIVGAKKIIKEEASDNVLKQYRSECIKALKDIYLPFIGDREIHIHLTFYNE